MSARVACVNPSRCSSRAERATYASRQLLAPSMTYAGWHPHASRARRMSSTSRCAMSKQWKKGSCCHRSTVLRRLVENSIDDISTQHVLYILNIPAACSPAYDASGHKNERGAVWRWLEFDRNFDHTCCWFSESTAFSIMSAEQTISYLSPHHSRRMHASATEQSCEQTECAHCGSATSDA